MREISDRLDAPTTPGTAQGCTQVQTSRLFLCGVAVRCAGELNRRSQHQWCNRSAFSFLPELGADSEGKGAIPSAGLFPAARTLPSGA